VLCSRITNNIDRTVKSLHAFFSEYGLREVFRMVYCAATGSQCLYQVYVKLCLPFPATNRQAAVVGAGAAPRPSSDHPAGQIAPHTTQCKHPDHHGARPQGELVCSPRELVLRFTICHLPLPPKEKRGHPRDEPGRQPGFFLDRTRLKCQGTECLYTALAGARRGRRWHPRNSKRPHAVPVITVWTPASRAVCPVCNTRRTGMRFL
jgi:hypothetical protein